MTGIILFRNVLTHESLMDQMYMQVPLVKKHITPTVIDTSRYIGGVLEQCIINTAL